MLNFFRRFFNPKINAVTVGEMGEGDKSVIRSFAKGNESVRSFAIDIHRRNIPMLGVRGTLEQDFMAEIDNPSPDLGLREIYRTRLLEN